MSIVSGAAAGSFTQTSVKTTHVGLLSIVWPEPHRSSWALPPRAPMVALRVVVALRRRGHRQLRRSCPRRSHRSIGGAFGVDQATFMVVPLPAAMTTAPTGGPMDETWRRVPGSCASPPAGVGAGDLRSSRSGARWSRPRAACCATSATASFAPQRGSVAFHCLAGWHTLVHLRRPTLALLTTEPEGWWPIRRLLSRCHTFILAGLSVPVNFIHTGRGRRLRRPPPRHRCPGGPSCRGAVGSAVANSPASDVSLRI
mmetsp:Transcript_84645/g.146841  ORF Transcript_84645/g.146841 Transcript_84645/m.146841 type:complete len:256 (-) Transcript_84645:938-1705(-)